MKAPELSSTAVLALVAVAVVGAFGLYAWRKGGVGAAAAAVGEGAVDLAGGIAGGAVGGVGAAVGLPTPAQTTTDAEVARWIIDHPMGGYIEASKWAGAPALFKAIGMGAGTGRPPAAGSDLAARFPVLPSASYDEGERLARRYPPPETAGATDYYSPDGVFLGSW